MAIKAKLLAAGCMAALLMTGQGAASKVLRVVDAAREGDREAVVSLLEAGADVNLPAGDGTTALAEAAHRNDLELVELLLAAGGDVRAANDYGATPLYLASANADAALVEELLRVGANPNLALLSGETPLMAAANRGKLRVVQSLLARGADPNLRESWGGQTALMWAVAGGHPEVVALLVEHGADVHARSSGQFTSLLFAAQQDDAESARVLLAAGVDVGERMTKTGLTPLLVASASGFQDVSAVLLEAGANPQAPDGNGYTPLHYAARDKDGVGLVKLLLAHGANPNARLPQGDPKRPAKTATGVSLEGATPLLLAAEINNFSAVLALLDGGADPLIPTQTNTTALMMAAGAGSSVAEERAAEERATAIETVTRLVELGTDVNGVGHFGWTALHSAAYQGLDDVIEYLVRHGANPDAMDGFGQTPLSICYTIVTEGMGDAYTQTPRTFRRKTADLLLALGATPLEASGVKRVSERAIESN